MFFPCVSGRLHRQEKSELAMRLSAWDTEPQEGELPVLRTRLRRARRALGDRIRKEDQPSAQQSSGQYSKSSNTSSLKLSPPRLDQHENRSEDI